MRRMSDASGDALRNEDLRMSKVAIKTLWLKLNLYQLGSHSLQACTQTVKKSVPESSWTWFNMKALKVQKNLALGTRGLL